MSMRPIIAVIIVGFLTLHTPGQEWVRLPDGSMAWARPAQSLVPNRAPIVLKTAGLQQILAKLWFVGARPVTDIGPGGALVELARILNSQPGMKALHANRPIYAGFYRPATLGTFRPLASSSEMSEILNYAVIVLPIVSEKRFYRSLDSRFERVESSTATIRQYRLQADRLDYEAWTKATLEGKIDPREVSPEGFARAGNDLLYCRSNGIYAAMTSNPRIAKDLALLDGSQEWVKLNPPEGSEPGVEEPAVATSFQAESFLHPDADVTANIRVSGNFAVGRDFFNERLRALASNLEEVTGGSNVRGQSETTLRAFSSTIANLLDTDYENLTDLELSFSIKGRDFDFAVRSRSNKNESWIPPVQTKKDPKAADQFLGRIPKGATAAGWVEDGLGARFRRVYVDLIAPLSTVYWLPASSVAGATTSEAAPSAGRFAYYLNLDPKKGFSFVEWMSLGKAPTSIDGIRKRIEEGTLLGRTLGRTAPDRQLEYVETRRVGNRKVFLFRFSGEKKSFFWEHQTRLESTLSRLLEHRYPIIATELDGRLICICSEHPIETLKTAIGHLSQPSDKAIGPLSFSNPRSIGFAGYFRPFPLQHFLLGAPEVPMETKGHRLYVLVGDDRSTKRLHIRGPIAFFDEFKSILSLSREQRQKIVTRQRMMILRRALQRQLATENKPATTASLESLFVAGNATPILPPFYRFVLEDGWGRSFRLRKNAAGELILTSLGSDGKPDGTGVAQDLVLRIR